MKKVKLLSYFRKLYQSRLGFRCVVLALTVVLYFLAPAAFDVLSGFQALRRFSILHVLWLLWMVDMALQLGQSRQYWPLGSQKFLKTAFLPLKDWAKRKEGLLAFIIKSRRDTLLVGLVWLALTAVIGAAHFLGWIDRNALLVISALFYVCDIICVLYWCPFRVWFMKNRCCTTCRIFNWDHMMMFSPLLFVPGLYTWSLCLMAFAVFLVWEIAFALHPERFWEGSNGALQCANCTDRLCGERNCRVDVPDLRGAVRKVKKHG